MSNKEPADKTMQEDQLEEPPITTSRSIEEFVVFGTEQNQDRLTSQLIRKSKRETI
jgi:hypothetical protein